MSTATDHESTHSSLIDDLLELRVTPVPRDHEDWVAMLSDVDRKGDAWRAHLDAVDAALDLVVPALQRVLESVSPSRDHGGCLNAENVRGCIGHVPRRREGRYVRE